MERFGLLMVAGLVLGLFSVGHGASYPVVDGPCHLSLPEDHAPHPAFRTEWWYYTGNVTDENGKEFGFQLTVFRSRLQPKEQGTRPALPSPWRADQIWMGHAAISDMEAGKHFHDGFLVRDAAGLGGALFDGKKLTLFLRNWSVQIKGNRHDLKAEGDGFRIRLVAEAVKPVVFHGEDGYSRKGSTRERASCYYSFTRMKTRGELETPNSRGKVEGFSWMDHEFSSAPLDPAAIGWDWFSLQLSDGWDLMAFQVRGKESGRILMTSGTLTDPEGKSHFLHEKDMALSVTRFWNSTVTGARYPAGWRLLVPQRQLQLDIRSRIPDQEMTLDRIPGGVTYWEGSVGVKGRHQNRGVTGLGYAELTGYAGAIGNRL